MKIYSPLHLLASLVALAAWSPPAHPTVFTTNEFFGFSQNTWGADPGAGPPASLVTTYFDSLYPVGMTLGSSGGFFVLFTAGSNGDALLRYLPSTGPAATLNATLVDPTTTSSGIFGGQIAGLRLNIDFSANGILPHPAAVPFGALQLTNLTGSVAGLNGQSLIQLQTVANVLLSGQFEPYSIADISALLMLVNGSFEGGFVSAWADDHLVIAAAVVPSVSEPAAPALLVMAAAAGVLARRKRRTCGARPSTAESHRSPCDRLP